MTPPISDLSPIATDRVGFTISRKVWDSEFFGREIHSVDIEGSLDVGALQREVALLDEKGVWALECHLRTADFVMAPVLEETGFRLVDSRMVFVSHWSLEDVVDAEVPYGTLRPVREDDLSRVNELATQNLVDNPTFRSRFTDRRLFARDESIRYYEAWNSLAFREAPELFVVWEVDGTVAGFFSYMRNGDSDGIPLYKGVLTAVDKTHRGHDVQNTMQAFLFRRFGVESWALDNTTQVSNLPVLKNHIKAQKRLEDAVLTFYRLTADQSVWTPASGVGE